MEDSVFGKMEYRRGWKKIERLFLLGYYQTVVIRINCEPNVFPSEIQKKAYISFHGAIDSVCDKAIPRVVELLKGYFGNIITEESFKEFIKPMEVIFFQSGKYSILCDILDSEDQLAILVNDDDVVVADSSIIEFEI